MVETLLTLLAGGGTGLLGSLFGRITGLFEEKQKIKRLEIELAHELKLQEMQISARINEREHEAEIAETGAYAQALIGSYSHDSSYANTLLRWVRPALTVFLLVMTGWVYHTSSGDVVKADIAKLIVFYAGTAVAWWFADRSGRVR